MRLFCAQNATASSTPIRVIDCGERVGLPMSSKPKSNSIRKRGRPSKYTPQLAATIFAALAEGQSLRSICENPEMPVRMTIVTWLARYPDFLDHYTRAREVGLDHFAEITLAEATDVDPERVQSAKLTWDARRWHLSKMLPKRYGDRIAQEHSGPDGSPVRLQALSPPMVPVEVRKAVQALLGKAEVQLGLPSGVGKDGKERLRAIMNSGQPLPPDVYEALYRGGDRNG
jgi:hypothetical protein